MARPTPLMEALLVHGPGEIILVRHGQQGDNRFNDPMRPYSGDVDLSELGRTQAQAVAGLLADEPIDAVYVSPMRRASQTGAAIAARHGLAPVVVEDLREIEGYRDLPPGQTVEQAIGAEGIEAMRQRFLAQRSWDALVYSEPGHEFRSRVQQALADIRSRHNEDSHIVVACHSGVINTLVAGVLGMNSDLVAFVAHASITRLITGDGRLAVRAVNQDGHLRSAGVLSY
jgi:broad specificity phosphatase PhoE